MSELQRAPLPMHGHPEGRWPTLATASDLRDGPELRLPANGFAPAIIPQRSGERHGSEQREKEK